MALFRLCAEVGSFGDARDIVARLGELFEPAPLATSFFENPETGGWRVDAYYDDAPDIAALAALLADVPSGAPELALEAVPDANWVAISQAALPPVAAGRFWVHGSHDRGRVGLRPNAIEIDAGEAFGTAHHATTLGCLEALDRLARRRLFARVLDLGCGSGVLGIAAGKALPRARLCASDVDPVAVAVANANAARNRSGRRLRAVAASGLDHPRLRREGRFDLVLANILAGPLILLANPLRRAVRAGGLCVLSGILTEQAHEVTAAYRAAGFSLLEARRIAGWSTLILERRPALPRQRCLRRARRAA